jgi:hypothetical protein
MTFLSMLVHFTAFCDIERLPEAACERLSPTPMNGAIFPPSTVHGQVVSRRADFENAFSCVPRALKAGEGFNSVRVDRCQCR